MAANTRNPVRSKGVGADGATKPKEDKRGFWAGVMTGAALGIGGYLGVELVKKMTGKSDDQPSLNPSSDAQLRILKGQAGAPAPARQPDQVKKRTIVEEIVSEYEG